MKPVIQIYDSEEDVLRTLAIAEKEGHLTETIIEKFVNKLFAMPVLWRCRKYFYMLDEDTLRKIPVLVTHMALICAMDGRLDEAKEYVSWLGDTPKDLKFDNFQLLDVLRIKTELVMPYTRDAMFFRIVFFIVGRDELAPVRDLTLSACRPSILNGFRDFTRYGRYLEQNRQLITETAVRLYGSVGEKVYEIASAEWYYQNNDCFHALILVTGTIPLIEQEKDMRCLFVALALQMKILMMNGQARAAHPLVQKIRQRIETTGWAELTSSLNALECLAACYDGRREDVIDWLEKKAPDENDGLYMMDMYAWLVKIRCYIQTGKYMAAYVLVEQLITLLTQGRRYMDLCECYMLSAIIHYKADEQQLMCEALSKTIALAKRYGYIRLLADEGTCMVQMLTIYQKEYGRDDFAEQVKELAASVGRYFPDYLKSLVEYYEPLTRTEQDVLRLMAQGMGNDEIAGRLEKKTGTIKFHSNNIYRKLQVSNRQGAVERAREIGII